MRVSIVVAAARNGVIGVRGDLPWRLPDDQRFFKEMTSGHCVVMGRKTFDTLGSPLPKRANFVLTRQPHDPIAGVEFFSDLSGALDQARKRGFEECYIAGGEEIYREGMTVADRIYLTRVDAEPEGDTRFPEINEAKWKRVDRKLHPADQHHVHSFAFETWDRLD